MLMSVLRDLTCVTPMLLASTLREITTAHVTLGTMEMDSLAMVNYKLEVTGHNDSLCLTLDTNECEDSLDTCDQDATCANTDGSFRCMCNLGFTGTGMNCTGKHNIGDPFWENQAKRENKKK